MSDSNNPPKLTPQLPRAGGRGPASAGATGAGGAASDAATPASAFTPAAPGRYVAPRPGAHQGTLSPSTADAPGLKVVTIAPAPARALFADTEDVTSARPSALRADPYIGATIDSRYKVEALLGEGGMGVVYRCSHTIIGKKVAMKVLRADLARDPEVTERFLNEAKSASAIGNAHIIEINDFGQFEDGATYFVMEYLTGIPLAQTVEGGVAMPLPRILHIARQLAEGLSAAHNVDIVHRDLKPDNVFLIDRGGEKDFVKILDFGIAKVSSEGAKLTRAGAVFGTPHYMSPEQAAGQPVDHRGDIYSLGVILYELASGRVPFDADNFMGILTQHVYKAPVPFRHFLRPGQEVPAGLEAVILKCLSKQPAQRYPSMVELIAELDLLRGGGVPTAVAEMLERAEGFDVSPDYFRQNAELAARPASAAPSARRRAALFALAASGIAIAATLLLVFGPFAKHGEAEPRAGTSASPLVAASVPAKDGSKLASAPNLAADATSKRQVVLAVEPLDAHVFSGSEDLGASPVVIEVEEGRTLTLQIRRDGYKPAQLALDGKNGREIVKLERVGLPRPSARANATGKARADGKADTKPKKKPTLGGNEIVNPWD